MSNRRTPPVLLALWLATPVMLSCDPADESGRGETSSAMTELIWRTPPPERSVVGQEFSVAFSVDTPGEIGATAIRVCAEEADCGLGSQYVEFPVTANAEDFRATFGLELGVWYVVAYAEVDDDPHVSDAVLVTIDPG